ncbi:GspH/FimT family pseudopilin [Pseudomonas matsuisoli]|nr:GspH/FimT family pseudopilin [Pseudomonas matsuisoli]
MNYQSQRAFTLVELAIIVSLIAVLVSFALPALGELQARNARDAIRNELMASLANARSTAVTSGRTVELCGSSDGEACDGAWSFGWLVRVNKETIHTHRMISPGQLSWHGVRKVIRYQANGTTSLSNGRFVFCPAMPTLENWHLIINRQGRTRIETRAPDAPSNRYCET